MNLLKAIEFLSSLAKPLFIVLLVAIGLLVAQFFITIGKTYTDKTPTDKYTDKWYSLTWGSGA
jgi:hypothetical protein